MDAATGLVPVVLDSIPFTTDPIPYDPLNWSKRDAKQKGVGLAVTIQDFGITIKDDVLTLGSGDKQILDLVTVKAFYARYLVQGATYAFSDWLGNVFTVYIHNFHPLPKIRGRLPSGGGDTLFTYTMELWVTGCSFLLCGPYTGA